MCNVCRQGVLRCEDSRHLVKEVMSKKNFNSSQSPKDSRAPQPLPPSLATTPGRTLLYPGESVGFGMEGGGLGGYQTRGGSGS